MAETTNGNGTPARIPDWGQWLAEEMRTSFNRLEKRMDEIVAEPTRRITELERDFASHETFSQTRVDALKAEIAVEREERKSIQGSLATWKWIITAVGVPGVVAFIGWLAKLAPPATAQ